MVVKTPLPFFQIRLPKLLFLVPGLSIFIKYNVLWIVWLLFDMVWWILMVSKSLWNKPVFHNFCKQKNNGFIWFISSTFWTIKNPFSLWLFICWQGNQVPGKLTLRPEFFFVAQNSLKCGEKSHFIAYFYEFYPTFSQSRVKIGP